jgi:glycosyltransferase involved in cell wall biosynthesis
MKVLMLTNLYPYPSRKPFGAFVKREVEALRALGVDVEVEVIEGWKNRLQYLKAYPRLWRKLNEERFDLIHAYFGYTALITAAQRRVPVVVTFCGDDALGTRGAHGRKTLLSRMLVKLSKAAAKTADTIIVKTRQMKEVFPSEARVMVIPSGVDLRVFRPLDRIECCRALGLPEEPLKVLFMGETFVPVKNFPLARKAVDALNKTGVDAMLLTVSNVSEEDVVLHMNACDTLLITSMAEGSPNVAVESMACNLPIVSVDVGDVRELINSVEGCHIAERNPDELSAALLKVLAARKRTDGRTLVANLDISRVSLRIIDVYRDVCRRAAEGSNRT